MKHIYLLSVLLFACLYGTAQTNIANYPYTITNGTYTPLAGGTDFIAANVPYNDEVSAAIPMPSFTFGGVAQTALYISANGYIQFGSAPTPTLYSPMFSATGNGMIAPFAANLGFTAGSATAGASSEISYGQDGNEFVVEYKDVKRFNIANERITAQIRLNSVTGEVKIVYGPNIVAGNSASYPQVGIKGNSALWTTNINDLKLAAPPNSCSWQDAVSGDNNTNAFLTFNSTIPALVPINGLTYTWTPLASPAPVRTFAAVSNIDAATGNATISWTAPTGATQYNVQYRTATSCSWTDYSGNPVAANTATLTGLPINTVYQVRVQASNGTNTSIWSHIPNQAGSGDGYSTNLGTFSFPCQVPTAQPTGLILSAVTAVTTNLTFTAASPAPSGGYLVVRTTTNVQPTPVNGTVYIINTTTPIGFVISNSTGTAFTSAALTPGTTYYYWIFSYNNTSCTGGPAYNLVSPLSGSQATNAAGNIQAITSGNWGTGSTWSSGTVPSQNDNVTIPDGITVIENATAFAYSLTIGNGISGALVFDATVGRTLTVGSDITIAPSANFITAPAGTITTHILNVGRSIFNNGFLDFSTNSNQAGANILFNTDGSGEFSGSGPVTNVRQITIQKGVVNNVIDIKPDNFTVRGVNTDVASFAVFSSGTLKISGTFTMTNRVFATPNYNIPSNAGFWLNNPNFTVAPQAGGTNCFNGGLLRMTRGTYNIGLTGADEMGSASNSTFIIEGGTINAMRWALNSIPTFFTMTGGTMNLGAQFNTRVNYATFDLIGSTSTFTMSGGTINITNAARNTTPADWRVASAPGNYNVTGGQVNFGNAATVTDTLFRVSGIIPSFIADNTVHNKNILLTGATTAFGDVIINSGDTLNTNNFNLSQNSGTIFKNDGVITTGNGISHLTFTGISPRLFTGSGVTGTILAPVQNFDIDVTGGLTFDPALVNNIITNRITFTNGNITNARKLTFGSGSFTTSPVFIIGSATAASDPGIIDEPFAYNIATLGEQLTYNKFLNPRNTGYEVVPTRFLTLVTVDNNTGAPLTVAGGNITTGLLTLTNGVVNTDATNMLVVTNNATLNRTNGWINGPFKRSLDLSVFTTADPRSLYPVGTATVYRPMRIAFTTAPTAIGSLTVESVSADAGFAGLPLTESGITLTNYSKEGYWRATASGSLGGTYSVELTGQGFTIGGVPAEARVIKRTNSSNPWTLQGIHAAATGNVVRRNGLSGFSEFAVGYFDAATLPISLLNFSGTRSNGINNLSWQTAMENNNAGFELQRSTDGNTFSKLTFIASKAINGNSSSTLTYNYTDAASLKINSYYRLKQLDKDNRPTLSNIVLLKGDKADVATLSIVYPNPVINNLNVVISSPAAQAFTVIITDITGKTIKQQPVNTVSGDTNVRLDVSSLAGGTYFVKLICASGCQALAGKFVK